MRRIFIKRGKKFVLEVETPPAPKTKKVPTAEVYVGRLIRKYEVFDPYAQLLTECRRLIPFVDDIGPVLSKQLANALRDMFGRSSRGVQSLARSLETRKGGA